MNSENLKQIVDQDEVQILFRIFSNYSENKLYLVGGCVRNALAGKDVVDIDFAIACTPEKIIDALSRSKIKYFDIGAKYGTITAIVNDQIFEITSFRKDQETDGRHAVVEYSNDIKVDAARRDFTINAIYLDEELNLYDFFDGYEDLQNNILQFIGRSDIRIKEDYLRILRFFRFYGDFSNQKIDSETLNALKKEANNLSLISKERILSEFSKILEQKDPLASLELMQELDILKYISKDIKISNSFYNLIGIEKKLELSVFLSRRLSMLLDNSSLKIDTYNSIYTLPSEIKKYLVKLSNIDHKIVSYLSVREARAKIYRLGLDLFLDQVIINWANDKNQKNEINWRALYEVGKNFEKPLFHVNAQYVINMGIKEGPLVGKILNELEDWWIDSGFVSDEYSLIERLKAICLSHK